MTLLLATRGFPTLVILELQKFQFARFAILIKNVPQSITQHLANLSEQTRKKKKSFQKNYTRIFSKSTLCNHFRTRD